MRRLDVSEYTMPVRVTNDRGETTLVDKPYPVKLGLRGILLNPQLQLGGIELLKHDDLASKIRDAQDDEVLLEQAEYALLKGAVEKVRGFADNDVPLVRRVLEAPEVPVIVKHDEDGNKAEA